MVRYARDAAFVCGFLLLSVGAGLAYLPAGLIVAGGVLIAVAIVGHRNAS